MGLLSDIGIVVALKSVILRVATPIANYFLLSPENVSLVMLLLLSMFVSYSLLKLVPGVGQNQGIKLLVGILLFFSVT